MMTATIFSFKKMDHPVKMGNRLSEAMYNLNVNEYRIIAHACSKIKKYSDPMDAILITPQEFQERFGTLNCYTELKEACLSLASKYVIFKKEDDPRKDKAHPWMHTCEYERITQSKNSEIRIIFNPVLHQDLYGLKEYFTLVNLEVLAKLTTPFSFRLYQWICRDRYLEVTKKNGFFERKLTLDEIIQSMTKPNLKNYTWDNFRQRHLIPALEQIKLCNDISIEWKPLKNGRSIIGMHFICKECNESYIKPIKPKLMKRAHAVKDSDKEWKWAVKNFNAMYAYNKEIIKHNEMTGKNIKMSLLELRQYHKYAVAAKYDLIAKEIQLEIDARTPAPKLDKRYDHLRYLCDHENGLTHLQFFEQMTEEDKNLIAEIVIYALGDFKLTDKERNIVSNTDMRKIMQQVTKNKLEELKKMYESDPTAKTIDIKHAEEEEEEPF